MAIEILDHINELVWGHVAFVLIMILGLYFSIRSRFFQLRRFGSIFKAFVSIVKEKHGTGPGVHTMKVFFAAVGGCIGIGNVVGIVTAVTIGGPGAIFWAWVGGIAGMLIQYAEVYLGMKHRVKNRQDSYDGGPMYFLPIAFKGKWIAPVISFLLCIYGVEIFMFNVMADSISVNWDLNPYWVVGILLAAILIVSIGGIGRVGAVCSALIPLFIVLYVVMALWVILQHASELPLIFSAIFKGAFTKQAAIGGFAGSTVPQAISMGLSRGAYSGDIGVGYTSVIYAESRTHKIQRQASMSIIGIFLDTFVICTLSILVVLTTGYWHTDTDVALMVQEALGHHFPFMHFFMPTFLFLLGYTTILAYFVVGIKCARFISKKWGPALYYLYAIIALPFFAFVEPSQAFVIMSLAGALLLIFNLTGIFLLRKEVRFGLE
jgi:AGCS family alanine or glycine:cation symporter